MDPAILALSIPIVALVGGYWVKLAKIRSAENGGGSAVLNQRLDMIENELEALKQEHAETQERLDFTERMLSNQRDAKQVNGT